jgi:hypothetical protein
VEVDDLREGLHRTSRRGGEGARSGALAGVVVVVGEDLEGDEQPEQSDVPAVGEDPEERGAVEEGPLVSQCRERVLSRYRVGDLGGLPKPNAVLASHGA